MLRHSVSLILFVWLSIPASAQQLISPDEYVDGLVAAQLAPFVGISNPDPVLQEIIAERMQGLEFLRAILKGVNPGLPGVMGRNMQPIIPIPLRAEIRELAANALLATSGRLDVSAFEREYIYRYWPPDGEGEERSLVMYFTKKSLATGDIRHIERVSDRIVRTTGSFLSMDSNSVVLTILGSRFYNDPTYLHLLRAYARSMLEGSSFLTTQQWLALARPYFMTLCRHGINQLQAGSVGLPAISFKRLYDRFPSLGLKPHREATKAIYLADPMNNLLHAAGTIVPLEEGCPFLPEASAFGF